MHPTSGPVPIKPAPQGRGALIALVAGIVVIATLAMVSTLGAGASSGWSLSLPSAEAQAGVPFADVPEQGASSETEEAAGPRDGELDIVRRDADDPMAIGDVDAPVVLLEWMDFRCPYCGQWNREVLPDVIRDYVEGGLVRIEFQDVAYFGEESMAAAAAARAAGEQGRYVEFMDAFYAAAPSVTGADGHPSVSDDFLDEVARTAGVEDLDRFAADRVSPELAEQVTASMARAEELQVESVPFFVAGRSALSGAQPTETMSNFLDDALGREPGGIAG